MARTGTCGGARVERVAGYPGPESRYNLASETMRRDHCVPCRCGRWL